jgi:hypothetical protein
MSAAILILIATAAAVFAARQEADPAPQSRAAWARQIANWLFTIVVAFEMAAGALWDLLHIEYVRVVLTHLGYPLYLLYIIGVPRIPCALALLAPRFPRLKEWAYAGAFFNYAGAAASHLLAGDRVSVWLGPLILSAFTLASWALRPSSRRLGQTAQAIQPRALAWSAPVVITAAMIVVAFLTLPKGAPARNEDERLRLSQQVTAKPAIQATPVRFVTHHVPIALPWSKVQEAVLRSDGRSSPYRRCLSANRLRILAPWSSKNRGSRLRT